MAKVRGSRYKVNKMTKSQVMDILAEVAVYLSFNWHSKNKDLARADALRLCMETLDSLKTWRTKKSQGKKMIIKGPMALTSDMLFDPVAREEINKSGRGVKIKESPPKKHVKKKTKKIDPATEVRLLTQEEVNALLEAVLLDPEPESDAALEPSFIGSDSLEELPKRVPRRRVPLRRRQSFYSRTRSRHARIDRKR